MYCPLLKLGLHTWIGSDGESDLDSGIGPCHFLVDMRGIEARAFFSKLS